MFPNNNDDTSFDTYFKKNFKDSDYKCKDGDNACIDKDCRYEELCNNECNRYYNITREEEGEGECNVTQGSLVPNREKCPYGEGECRDRDCEYTEYCDSLCQKRYKITLNKEGNGTCKNENGDEIIDNDIVPGGTCANNEDECINVDCIFEKKCGTDCLRRIEILEKEKGIGKCKVDQGAEVKDQPCLNGEGDCLKRDCDYETKCNYKCQKKYNITKQALGVGDCPVVDNSIVQDSYCSNEEGDCIREDCKYKQHCNPMCEKVYKVVEKEQGEGICPITDNQLVPNGVCQNGENECIKKDCEYTEFCDSNCTSCGSKYF